LNGRSLTFSEAIREALYEEMIKDERVFIMGEDVRRQGITKTLWEEFGNDRIINTPIAESAFTGAGIGAAITGMKPVIYHSRCDFTLYAIDSIANQAAKWTFHTGGQFKVPLVIRVGTGGYRGSGCHHSQSLESIYMNVPGIDVVMPSTPYDAKGLLKTALEKDHPVMFFEHNQLMNFEGIVPEKKYEIPFGLADIKKKGEDASIVTVGFMVHKALEAASQLLKENIDVEVVDLRTLIPLDEKSIVDSVKKTGRLITIEESCKTGGVGAEVAAVVVENAFDKLKAPLMRIANPDAMVPYKTFNEAYVLPQVEDIVETVTKIIH